jgi:ATP-dependent Zn protease
MFLNGSRLEPGLAVSEIAARLNGFAPADLQAICITAKRMAFNRSTKADQLPPLNWSDFDKAVDRIRGGMVQANGTDSR